MNSDFTDIIFICFIGFIFWVSVTATIKDQHYKHDVTPAEQIRLCVWYYDICHDSKKNPKHEVWTDEGKAQLTEWVRVKFPVTLIDELPGEKIKEWVRRAKG